MNALIFAAAVAAAASDTPRDYSHVIPLSLSGKPGVVQLQLPREAYLNARSPSLNDVRVFDAQGVLQPFALHQPEAETSTTHRALPVRVFPLMAGRPDVPLAGLEVSTATDGRVLSVRLPSQQAAAPGRPRETLAALVLDLRQEGSNAPPLVDALHFSLPTGRSNYTGQVWLEASDDLKRWETVGVAELSWLSNASEETLANDKLEFAARPMRYARLGWRSGEPLQFASISAQSPVRREAPVAAESLLLQAEPGRDARDLQYTRPPGVAPLRAGLQLDSGNMVLPATLGSYRQQHRTGQYRFEPAVRTTFYASTVSNPPCAPPSTGWSSRTRYAYPTISSCHPGSANSWCCASTSRRRSSRRCASAGSQPRWCSLPVARRPTRWPWGASMRRRGRAISPKWRPASRRPNCVRWSARRPARRRRKPKRWPMPLSAPVPRPARPSAA
jgi:hypothetical protein